MCIYGYDKFSSLCSVLLLSDWFINTLKQFLFLYHLIFITVILFFVVIHKAIIFSRKNFLIKVWTNNSRQNESELIQMINESHCQQVQSLQSPDLISYLLINFGLSLDESALWLFSN